MVYKWYCNIDIDVLKNVIAVLENAILFINSNYFFQQVTH